MLIIVQIFCGGYKNFSHHDFEAPLKNTKEFM